MNLEINYQKLTDIIKSFYKITKIKIIIFDENHNVICAYPEKDSSFCRKMKSNPFTCNKCIQNDLNVFNECKKAQKLIMYTCHAGLVEGCAPLKHGNTVLGYIMFGQISDFPSRTVLLQNISSVCREYSLNEEDFLGASKSIKIRDYDYIMASAKLFEACASYIMVQDMLLPENNRIIIESEKYIEENLESVTVSSLCSHLNISRTKIYEVFRQNAGTGVSSFIREKQFEKARKLLSAGSLPIKEISKYKENVCK